MSSIAYSRPELALELRQLHKSFGHLEVIRDLSLRLPRERTLALVGPSGCGKSTILNLIMLQAAD
ncbi:MAG: ATP-binding cassette domain-containing protein [Spirochaetota bacterium]